MAILTAAFVDTPPGAHSRSHTFAQSHLFAKAVLTGCIRFFAQSGGDSVRRRSPNAELLGCWTGRQAALGEFLRRCNRLRIERRAAQ